MNSKDAYIEHMGNTIKDLQKQVSTVGRKNWLFADTPKGATASAAIYSIIETAKANNLNVYTYLGYLLLYMPDVDRKTNQILWII
mgnify:CR=1 FL=1